MTSVFENKEKEWRERGYKVEYDEVNQIENGYADEVRDGRMPEITYTFYIFDKNGEEVWLYSLDTKQEGYQKAFEWLEKNRW